MTSQPRLGPSALQLFHFTQAAIHGRSIMCAQNKRNEGVDPVPEGSTLISIENNQWTLVPGLELSSPPMSQTTIGLNLIHPPCSCISLVLSEAVDRLHNNMAIKKVALVCLEIGFAG